MLAHFPLYIFLHTHGDASFSEKGLKGLYILSSERIPTMLSILEALILVVSTAGLTLALLVLYVRKAIPSMLNSVAMGVSEHINEGLKETFASPNVKKAFTILGKQSGAVRADGALRNRVADQLIGKYPSINMILDQLDLTPIEGLQLINDPLIGPFIKGFMEKGLKGVLGGGKTKTSDFGVKF